MIIKNFGKDSLFLSSHYKEFHKINASDNSKPSGRLMGIDVGTKRIGIATSDELMMISTPRTIIVRKSNEADFAKIKKMIEEMEVRAIVIGFSINMNGTLNHMSQFTENFANELDKFLDYKFNIYFADERLTTFEARGISGSLKSRKGKRHYDDIAASIILRDFIEQL